MHRATRIAILSAIVAAAVPAGGAGAAEIGVSAPLSGPVALLGAQIRDGATLAASRAGLELAIADDVCTAEGGAAAARKLVAEQVRIVVGYLCTEAIEAALPIFTQARIPVITVGVRTDGLTDRRLRTGWAVHRLAPRADAEREAAAALIVRLWRDRLFAIVDDGTIYGRELAESLRLSAEQAGLQPVFVDTFRPQLENQIALVGRLRRAGATEVFVGGDRDDAAIIGRDAAAGGNGLGIAGGEALRAAPGNDVPLAVGTLMIGMPQYDTQDEALEAAFAEAGIVPEGYVLPAHAGVEVAAEAIRAAGAAALPLDLSGRDFATALGPVRFDEKGDLAENPYRAFRFDGAGFVPVEVP